MGKANSGSACGFGVRRAIAGLLSFAVLAAPAIGLADACETRVGAAMEQLLEQRLIAEGPADRNAARQILTRLCDNTVEETRVEIEQRAAEPTRILGVDFHRAPDDSDGHKRLRK